MDRARAQLLKGPHRWEAELVEITGNEPLAEYADGSRVPPTGADLDVYRERLGGDEGEWPIDGSDETVHLSLADWRDAPPYKRFTLHVRLIPNKPMRIRRPVAELFVDALPAREAEAVTLDDWLDRPVEHMTRRRQADGSYVDDGTVIETPREELARWPRPAPTRDTLVRGLKRLAAEGLVGRIGAGTRSDPYRYWHRQRLIPGGPGTAAG